MSMLNTPLLTAARLSVLLALATAGCVEKPPAPAASNVKLYAFDFAGGARQCTAPADVALTPGRETPVAITLGNDGGWCAFKVGQSGRPFTAGLLATRPAHGKVYVHTVGNDTRVDYTPDARYAGSDAFSVQLLPGDLAIRVAVTVNPG